MNPDQLVALLLLLADLRLTTERQSVRIAELEKELADTKE